MRLRRVPEGGVARTTFPPLISGLVPPGERRPAAHSSCPEPGSFAALQMLHRRAEMSRCQKADLVGCRN